MRIRKLIPSVNFHLWSACNMKCKYCFAGFQDVKSSILPKGHLPKEDAITIVKQLIAYGFEKITFVGGEPMLCPWLSDLIKVAKEGGLTTMIVTNGSRLTGSFLKENRGYLDWITLSIDSLSPAINKKIGRCESKQAPFNASAYLQLIDHINIWGYKLKINTVVHSYNRHDDMNRFIEKAKPSRWKVFQALAVKGQNDLNIESLKVSKTGFNDFIMRHIATKPITESNEEMRGSYMMVDPAGRFFDNVKGHHRYSDSILEVGVDKAMRQVVFDYDKYASRGGKYEW